MYLSKKIIFALALFSQFLVFYATGADDLDVQIEPIPLLIGETAQLKLISSVGSPQLIDFPEIPGVKWLSRSPSSSQQTTIINGRKSSMYISVYPFAATKEGKISIPPLKVSVNSKKTLTEAFEANAFKRKLSVQSQPGSDESSGSEKELSAIEDLIFIKAYPLTDKQEVIVGEEIPFEIRLYMLNGLKCEPTWPEIKLENVIFKDYSSVNQQNPLFEPVRTSEEKVKGRNFTVVLFRTAFRPISSGELKGEVSSTCRILIPRDRNQRQNRNRDPFFGDLDLFSPFSSQYEELKHDLTASVGPIQVKPLPPCPDGSEFLGIVGNWNVIPEISTEKLRTGETVTLKLLISGEGTIETLKAPEISIPGFRVYPPEIGKATLVPGGKSRNDIRFVLIPLEEGPASINLNFCYFSTQSGKYVEVPFKRNFTVAKGDSKANTEVFLETVNPNEKIEGSKKKPKPNGLLAPKKTSGSEFSLPLWENMIFPSMVLFLLAFLIPLGVETGRAWKLKINADPVLKRKMEARSRRSRILREIRKSGDAEIHNTIQNSVLPFIIDSLGLPPGTSITELVKHVDDKELADCLKEGEVSSYMPGAMSGADLRKRLLNGLKKSFMIFAILLAASWTQGADKEKASEPAHAATPPPAASSSDPLDAYYNGDFAKAAQYYKDRLNLKRPDPVVLYNLGDCLYQLGELPQALVCFERALRLSPRDSDVRENLNHIRRKLALPEKGGIEHPSDLIGAARDFLRPDEWILLGGIFCLAAGILFTLRRSFTSKSWMIVFAVLLLLTVISIVAPMIQYETSYSGDIAFITERNIPTYMLPTENAERAQFRFNDGEEVQALEERNGWTRIRSGGSEGWVRSDHIQRLWP